MADWSFLTSHARVLLCITHDPGTRLRDIAVRTAITGHRLQHRHRSHQARIRRQAQRRPRCQIQAHLPLNPRPAAGNAYRRDPGTPDRAPTMRRRQDSGRLDREWNHRRRHLVPTRPRSSSRGPGSADGRRVPGRAQQARGGRSTRDGALRHLAAGTQSQKAQSGPDLQMPPNL